MTCSPTERTCVSDVPLAMTKQSVMSVTFLRSSTTTSFAFMSRQCAAARCATATAVGSVDAIQQVQKLSAGWFPSAKVLRDRPECSRSGGTFCICYASLPSWLLLDHPDFYLGADVGVDPD